MTDKFKFISFVNDGDDAYEPLYENYMASLERCGIKHMHELRTVEHNASGEYASEDFNKVVYLRTLEVKELVEQGYTVLHTDLDIVFLKDPIPVLLSYLADHDIAFQQDSKQFCTGFYITKPFSRCSDFFDYDFENYKHLHDQDHISWKLNPTLTDDGLVARPRKPHNDLKVKALDRDLFPYGRWFYMNQDRVTAPYIVHYNWGNPKTVDGKIERMKKYGHWFL